MRSSSTSEEEEDVGDDKAAVVKGEEGRSDDRAAALLHVTSRCMPVEIEDRRLENGKENVGMGEQ